MAGSPLRCPRRGDRGVHRLRAAATIRGPQPVEFLTRDHALAEDLLQTALTRAWFAWGRIDGSPEPYVRRMLASTYASWWRRKWNGEQATAELPEGGGDHFSADVSTSHDLWEALGRLTRRQRA